MLHLALLLYLLLLSLSPADASANMSVPAFYGDEATGFGPVFEEKPVDTIYPEESPEAKITMNCKARAKPPASYKWLQNNTEINLNEKDPHYSLIGGNLVISNPIRTQHVGKYSCLATNKFGTVISKEASVQFGYLDLFSSEERMTVKVKEGQGAVLLCAPPPHYPAELSFRWILNEFPTFIPLDKRRFVSQTTGNLYISKVDSSDRGNYSCIASSPSISKSVFSNYITLEPQTGSSSRKYLADLRVRFPDTTALVGQNVTLECFALGNPVPDITWRRIGGEMPHRHEVRMAGAQLHLFDVTFEDSGTYECKAKNSRGEDDHNARVTVEAFPEWLEQISSTERGLHSDYTMSCVASGIPKPQIRWLKNGKPIDRKEMRFRRLTFNDSGMYQCIAENHHGVIYANAELRVFARAPTFEHNRVKTVWAAENGRVVIQCRPKAAPKPKFYWSKDTELLTNSSRVLIWEDGSLEMLSVTKADEGSYTCFAENDQGKASSTSSLLIANSTKISLSPSNVVVNVGESATMHCNASHDPSLEISFKWSLNGGDSDFLKDSQHYERTTNEDSISKLLIKNAQLKHAGIYTCMAQTAADNDTASANLTVKGPPGAPGGVRIIDKTDKTVTLQWSRGANHGNSISKYTIQYKDEFLKDLWKNATTSPADVDGMAEAAMVVNLFPWTEYEFRVIATNMLGTGDPSKPSPKERTLGSVPEVAPSNVTGGGGNSRELTIMWKPVDPQYYNGPYFGYIVAFKRLGEYEWKRVEMPDARAGHYVHKDPNIPPLTEFEVKVKAFNSQGEGPYSLTAIIYSAQDAPSEAPVILEGRALSATMATVAWTPLPQSPQSSIDGYQVKYWKNHDEGEAGAKWVRVSSKENHTKLEGLEPYSNYLIEIRGCNSAGCGPPSKHFKIQTKKPPPDRPPKIIGTKLKGQSVNIIWEQVKSLGNESEIDGYRVLYKRKGNTSGTLYTTGKQSIDLPRRSDGEYVVEVRVHTEGGDGTVAQIYIPPMSHSERIPVTSSFTVLSLLLVVLFFLNL